VLQLSNVAVPELGSPGSKCMCHANDLLVQTSTNQVAIQHTTPVRHDLPVIVLSAGQKPTINTGRVCDRTQQTARPTHSFPCGGSTIGHRSPVKNEHVNSKDRRDVALDPAACPSPAACLSPLTLIWIDIACHLHVLLWRAGHLRPRRRHHHTTAHCRSTTACPPP
jgi:hypothetical protein